jgi:hypothetical protein
MKIQPNHHLFLSFSFHSERVKERSSLPLHLEGVGGRFNLPSKSAGLRYVNKQLHIIKTHWAQKPKNPV